MSDNQQHQEQTQRQEKRNVFGRAWDTIEKLWTNLKQKKSILYVLGLILAFVIGSSISGIIENFASRKFDSATSESDKHIAVVITNKSDESFSIPKEFREGFGSDASFKFTQNGQLIECKTDDDALSTKQAELLAKKYITNPNCVLIIGNSTSSLTEVTLNSLLEYNGTKPAFLLPIATADNITDKAKDQGYNGILRMMPNNESQAVTIKNFIFHKFPVKPKVLLYVDEDNLTYSQNLSQQISDKVIKSNGTIILKKNYGNSNRLINDIESLKRNNRMPDIIVFVGISTNGSLLMEELNNLNLSNIPIVFSDGCTVNSLMEKSMTSKNHFYISAVQISNTNKYLPTYEPVGKDANMIATEILKSINGKITRESVNDYIEEIRRTNKAFQGTSGKYSFDQKGENTALHWKVYGYIDTKLTLAYEDN